MFGKKYKFENLTKFYDYISTCSYDAMLEFCKKEKLYLIYNRKNKDLKEKISDFIKIKNELFMTEKDWDKRIIYQRRRISEDIKLTTDEDVLSRS